MLKTYCVDIDGTICSPTVGRDYHKALPWKDRISKINKLYDEGNTIIYFTARGMGRFAGDPDAATKAAAILTDLTKDQLKSWGCKYHTLILGKPHADYFIDDKGINSDEFFRN
jgi:uncharacterized HAD superfamily protein|tara:strand:- start:250 stop:588 length:339 start_codon:yes stop_codon:yes gene_type:complete